MKGRQKIILLGDTGVGKTSLINSLIQGKYQQKLANTLGVCFHKYHCKVDQEAAVQMDIWDTAGQQKYRSLLTIYYRNADGIILVFDLSRPDTLQAIKYWAKQIEQYSQKNPIIILVGNKSDLVQQSQQSFKVKQQIQVYKRKPNWKYVICSAKYHQNVENIFKALGQMIKSRKQEQKSNKKAKKNQMRIKNKKKRHQQSSCC